MTTTENRTRPYMTAAEAYDWWANATGQADDGATTMLALTVDRLEHIDASLDRLASAAERIAEALGATPATEASTAFSTWLLAQAERDDPVGDLARDYGTGVETRAHGADHRTPEEVRRDVLDPCHASSGAYESLDRAEAEWRTL
jgi:hypothetical protein